MKTYHPIHWLETIQWHDIFTEQKVMAGAVIIGFIALFALLVIMNVKNGGMSAMPMK